MKQDILTQHNIPHYIESPMYELELTVQHIKMFARQLFQKIDSPIKPEEFIILDTVSMHNGLCQRDLAKKILKDRANTGRILDNLEKLNLIERENTTKNNRLVRIIKIKKEGREVIKNISEKLGLLNSILEKDTCKKEDEKQLVEFLRKIRENLKKIIDIQI